MKRLLYQERIRMINGADQNSAIAVLIDADNAHPSIIEGLMGEVAKLGLSSVKRIYGDWTTPNWR